MEPERLQSKPLNASRPDAAHLLLQVTDKDLPQHIVNGFMRYSNFSPFAEGGNAVIEQCLDKNLGRVVLMKRLHPDIEEHESERRRFLREARVTALIQHPGTVPVYEISRDADKRLYFTMKKIEGEDMRTILEGIVARKPTYKNDYPLTYLIEILVQVGQAVAFAHSQGVVHRDLKPANIIVGGFGEVMVLDWGLAKVWNAKDPEGEGGVGNQLDVELTQLGKRCGTPLYMSPEQAAGEIDAIDGRSDIYSLGAILYEVLTHENLAWGADKEEVLKVVLEETPPPPRKRAPNRSIPAELESICLKAIARKPADRYAAMTDMIDDLKAWLQHNTVQAHTYSVWQRFINWERRHVILILCLASTALGALFTVLLNYFTR